MRKRAAYLVAFLCLFPVSRFASQQPADEALRGLHIDPDLEVSLWATEPDVINPTNMDIDERGRVWITEAVNYRRQLFNQPDYRDEGDRIVILEDTDYDGKADQVKAFLQDRSLRSPLGIAVLGNKVIVSQSPDVLVFTKDENDNIVNRELFLTGWGGEDHDHGVHAIVYGPDGYYYFNNGDRGLDVTDRSGQRIASGPHEKYYAGSALRARPNGTGLEVIGHNFRNPYELTIDSFGNLWQSDNDDDGNEWVRINYVVRGGNHGYWGPLGKRWQEDRGTHFHQEDPGVIPTVLRTGAGSPSGITVYEGRLLPRRFWGNLLHVDNGPRVLRLYEIQPQGAGFQLSMDNVIEGLDTWFRPSDLAVAPDGSVFIADWYDAVVGGHQMKDTALGRIYRLAPPGHKPAKPAVDLSTPQGRARALASANQSIRYLAHSRFTEMSDGALPELAALLQETDPVLRARALWLLGGSGNRGLQKVMEEFGSPDPQFRVLAVRVLREYGLNFVEAVKPLLHDPSSQVRREIALALRDGPLEETRSAFLELATQYDDKDRWYLEALAIGAQTKEEGIYEDLLRAFPAAWDRRLGKLLWVLRPPQAVSFLKAAALNQKLPPGDRIEAVEALGAQRSPHIGLFLADLAISQEPLKLRAKAAERLIKQLFSLWTDLRSSARIVPALRVALQIPDTRTRALDLIGELGDPGYSSDVFRLAEDPALPLAVRSQALETAGKLSDPSNLSRFETFLKGGPGEMRLAGVRALGALDHDNARKALVELILSDASNELRSQAVRALGRSDRGLRQLLNLAEANRLPEELRGSAVIAVNSSRRPEIQKQAQEILPMFSTRTQEFIQQPRAFLLRVQGRAEAGREVFFGQGQCSSCHNVAAGEEKMGPDLATIGDKLGREGLFDAIVNPSAGVAPEYVTWIIRTPSDGEIRGFMVADTPHHITLRDSSGTRRTFLKPDIVERKRDPVSAMPNLLGLLSEQELADLIAYLETLKR